MVATPKLPLKLRRKGAHHPIVEEEDLYVEGGSYSMRHHSASFNPYPSSDDSFPQSPGLSFTASSPTRSMFTPEPPSSPLGMPAVVSSPKSFWHVAFNYDSNFSYKSYPSSKLPKNSVFGQEKAHNHRRGSSESAPPLISDTEPSEYSEDLDVFSVHDDGMDDRSAMNGYKEEVIASRSEDRRDVKRQWSDRSSAQNVMNQSDGEYDIAAALLDLSRQVRIAAGSIPTKSAIDCTKSVSKGAVTAIEAKRGVSSSPLAMVAIDKDSHSVTDDCNASTAARAVNSGLDECKDESNMHSGKGSFNAIAQSAPPVAVGILRNTIPDRHPESQMIDTSVNIASESGSATQECEIVGHDGLISNAEESTIVHVGLENVPSTEEMCLDNSLAAPTRPDLEPDLEDALIASIFSTTLTPISSPVISAQDASDVIESISRAPSPEIISPIIQKSSQISSGDEKRRLLEDKENIRTTSRDMSPTPGSSSSRTAIESRKASVTSKPRERKSNTRKQRSEYDLHDTRSATPDHLGRHETSMDQKKRPHRESISLTRSSSPVPSTSSTATHKPKKRKNKTEDGTDTSREVRDVATANVSKTSRLSSSSDSRTAPPAEMLEDTPNVKESSMDILMRKDMFGSLIQTMALSRASSMPVSSLLREVLRENPHLADQMSKATWQALAEEVLQSHAVFGRVERQGLDAADKPLEALWYYIPEKDPDQDRAALLREMMPKKRGETMKYKQYYYRPVSKITRWDAEDDV